MYILYQGNDLENHCPFWNKLLKRMYGSTNSDWCCMEQSMGIVLSLNPGLMYSYLGILILFICEIHRNPINKLAQPCVHILRTNPILLGEKPRQLLRVIDLSCIIQKSVFLAGTPHLVRLRSKSVLASIISNTSRSIMLIYIVNDGSYRRYAL
jgi:hypothetical protein